MSKYYVVSGDILPDVLEQVMQARILLQSGKAKRISEAVKMVGISRGTYYKYKDAVFPYIKKENTGILTVQFILVDRPGVLVSLLTVFYEAGANILTVNQNIPVKGRAFVSVSARIGRMSQTPDALLEQLKAVNGVVKIESIVD